MKLMAIIAVFLVGCSTTFRPEDRDVDEDALEELLEDTPAEVWDEPWEDADEDPVEPDGPCGAPSDDCDGDGTTPEGGDCCDDERLAFPGQDEWFSVPFYCPDESWDYNCDGIEELEYEATSTMPIYCSSYSSRSVCEGTSGWYDEVPECGSVGRFVNCYWVTSSGVCAPGDDYEGLVRCR
jgi:hypothetical protein